MGRFQFILNNKLKQQGELWWCGEGLLFAACCPVTISQERGKGRGGERRGYKLSPAEHPANTSETRNKTPHSSVARYEPRRTPPPLRRMARCLISAQSPDSAVVAPAGPMCLCLDARRWDIRNGESVGGDEVRWCAAGR
ncbi:hypothetical protein INR49_028910 [Caranx melampygus]|nr:hypothetical protein INR49_028910 [Caranx melampygus]